MWTVSSKPFGIWVAYIRRLALGAGRQGNPSGNITNNTNITNRTKQMTNVKYYQKSMYHQIVGRLCTGTRLFR
jgi:hypothetical protein